MSTSPDRPVVLLVEDESSIAEPFASRRPHLVLLDLSLPDGDGRALCRDWRRESQVPIIMLTARGTETDRVVGLELGADDYVVKPFSSAEVIARIRAVLRRSGREAVHDPPVEIDGLRIDPSART